MSALRQENSHNMSIDMFNDSASLLHNFEDSVLDLTLNELRLDDNFIGENDENEKELNEDLSQLSGPSIRCFLLDKSRKSLLSQDDPFLNSIVYETAALSIWTLYKYQPLALKYHVMAKDKLIRTIISPVKSGNTMVEACRQKLGISRKDTNPSDPPEIRKLKDKVSVTKELVMRCRELPAEWNVIQLCKRYNANQGHQLMYDYKTAHLPLNITLFKYERSELMDHKPLCVCIHAEKFNVYKDAYDLTLDMNNNGKDAPNRSADFDTRIHNNIQLLQQFLGPWVVLFSGRAKTPKSVQHESYIFNMVDSFCSSSKVTPKFNPRQRVLISLVSRRIEMLTADQLGVAAKTISDNEKQYEELSEFLLQTAKSVKQVDCAYSPTTLIVDELVDYAFWEMAFPTQEFARVGSMAVLFKLYEKYRDQIKEGYLQVKVDNGFVLCNPENNLQQSEKRLRPLFNNWYPRYNFESGQVPVLGSFKKSLNDADVYIYAGHGSGMQFISGRDIQECNLHCVSFLYGCQSVALKSSGLQSECIGAHTYLHYALCPAVIGTLNATTDTWTDIITIGVCKMWLPTSSPDFTIFDSWSNGNKFYSNAIAHVKSQSKKSSLLEVMQVFRGCAKIPLRLRCTFVYRGIPVARHTS